MYHICMYIYIYIAHIHIHVYVRVELAERRQDLAPDAVAEVRRGGARAEARVDDPNSLVYYVMLY